MSWLVTCLLAAALTLCVYGDGSHYKEGETVWGAEDEERVLSVCSLCVFRSRCT